MKQSWLSPVVWGLLLFSGCVSAPPRAPVAPTPPVKAPALIRLSPTEIPAFRDDADTATLRTAALASAAYFRSLPPSQSVVVGTDSYGAAALAASLETLAAALQSAKTPDDWMRSLREDFLWYQSVGADEQRTVTYSSYYEPTIPARLAPGKDFRYPLYGRPGDLIDVDLGLFDAQWQGARLSGRRRGNNLIPYYTREEIDSRRRLADAGLEIAWTQNPLDIYFLQTEGSGWLDVGLSTAPVRVRYDGNNGQKYRSIGQYLISTGKVRAQGFGHKELIRYMDTHPKERQRVLNANPRYVFFRIDTSSAAPYAYGNIDVPLTAGRSIATDPKVFPKGMLAWVDVTGVPGRPAGRLQRFVLNQDEGGAIQGPGRVDFFAGHGPEAEMFATHFWNAGKLYFLVAKDRPKT